MAKRALKLIVETNKIGEPYISLLGANGETILTGEGYSSNQAMQHTLNLLLGATLPTEFEDMRENNEK